jgi:hypothetical protein
MRIDVDAVPRTLLAGDFDSDGVLDLISGNNTANRLSLVRTACDLELANGATVASPNGGEIWISPSEHTLTWTRDPGCASVNLDLSRDGGLNWERIASNVPGTSYSWTATDPYTNQARLRVSNAFVPAAADVSDANFTLVPQNLLDAPAASTVAALAIRRVVPNPTRGEMTIELALPTAADATLELLDVAGRRVAARNVATGAGVSRVAWQGPRLAPGVYVLRLAQGARRVTAKVAVVE